MGQLPLAVVLGKEAWLPAEPAELQGPLALLWPDRQRAHRPRERGQRAGQRLEQKQLGQRQLELELGPLDLEQRGQEQVGRQVPGRRRSGLVEWE
jgi:hypothetical protein